MKSIAVWRWRLHSQSTGRTYISHKCMTQAEALAKDPLAVRVEWSVAARLVPEVREEEVPPKLEREE